MLSNPREKIKRKIYMTKQIQYRYLILSNDYENSDMFNYSGGNNAL